MTSGAQLNCWVGLAIALLIGVGFILGLYYRARGTRATTSTTYYEPPTVYRNRKDWE